MLQNNETERLQTFAKAIRLWTLKEIKNLGFGHIGGAASVVDTLAVLYGKVMNIDPKNPKWPERDYLVCSKGHAGPAIYATLALKGYFPLEELMTLNTNGTNLPSHCDRNLTTGIDMTTGSLGQGVSTAIGIALGNRIDNRQNYTYLIIGDGELNEGQVWEGAMFAAHHKLSHLIAFVDENKKQLDGYTKDINDLGSIEDKFSAFGWHATTIKGNDVNAIYEAIENAKKVTDKPSCIVLDTVKGEGFPFVENADANHHMRFSESDHEEAQKIIEQLESELSQVEGNTSW